MELKTKGFIKSFEAVISAAIILIFVIGIFPNIHSVPKNENNLFLLINFLKNSDNSTFRNKILQENLSFVKNNLKNNFQNLQIKTGLLRLNSNHGFFTGNKTIYLEINKLKSEKELLFVWATNCSDISIKINEVSIYSKQQNPGNLTIELDLTNYTINGTNVLRFEGNFEKINYIADFYYYYIEQSEKTTVLGISYYISGNYTKLNPAALIVKEVK